MTPLKALKTLHILYAEDDADTNEHITYILKSFCAKVNTAKDGEKAKVLYEQLRPHIVILDHMMPKLSGLELAEHIKQCTPQTKVIMLSAHSEREHLMQAINSQVDAYLTKPTDLQSIQEALIKCSQALLRENLLSQTLADNLEYNLITKTLYAQDEVIHLTPTENLLLELLVSHANEVLSYERIFAFIDANNTMNKQSLKNLILKLKKKMQSEQIENIYNQGYRLNT